MTDRLIVADARKVSGRDFLRTSLAMFAERREVSEAEDREHRLGSVNAIRARNGDAPLTWEELQAIWTGDHRPELLPENRGKWVA